MQFLIYTIFTSIASAMAYNSTSNSTMANSTTLTSAAIESKNWCPGDCSLGLDQPKLNQICACPPKPNHSHCQVPKCSLGVGKFGGSLCACPIAAKTALKTI